MTSHTLAPNRHSDKGKNVQRDVIGGSLIIAGALIGIVVVSLHPTGHDLLNAESFAGMARRNMAVHATALATVPMLFLGLVTLTRRLGPSDLATAALVVYGLSGITIVMAAIASGFIATGVFERILEADAATSTVYQALGVYTGLINQGFARVSVVASSAAIGLWSAAILATGRMPRAVGVAGALIGAGLIIAVVSGHLSLGLHGFAIVTVAQVVWLVWIGILLCRKTISTPVS